MVLVGLILILGNAILNRLQQPAGSAVNAMLELPVKPGESANPLPSLSPTITSPDTGPAVPRPSTRARFDPGVLRQLTETCRYWAARNTRGQYDGLQQQACDQMNRYARDFGRTAGPVAAKTVRQAPSGTGSLPSDLPQIPVDQCERHGIGSMDFRQCRAREKTRLTSQCRDLRLTRDRAEGARYQTLSRLAEASCREADRYAIVR